MASLSIGRPPKGVNVSSLLDDSPTAAEDNEASGSQELQQDSIDEAEESFCVVEEETDRFVINEGRVDYEDEVGTSGIGENLIMKTESEDSSEPIDYSITASHEGTNSPFLGIECTVCHKMLRNERTMTEHMRLHTGERPFACTDCNAAFISMDALRRHRYSVHLDIRPERPGPVFCSVCQKELANDRTLKEHMRMHTGERPYPCDQCDMSFMALDRLRRHQKTDHLGERPDPLECPICFKELSNGHSLRRHMLVHTGERNFTCEECGKVFRTATDLNVHSKIHTGERPYKCEMCGGGYIKPSDLAKHMKRKHPEVITGDDDDDSDETTGDSIFDPIMNLDAKAALALFDGTVTAPNGFECPFCKREMANQRNLTEHMRTHTGEKPFSCDKCDATFMSADRLRRHKKNIHSKEKRIPTDLVDCPICTKKFPKRKMDDHIRSHTGERPFPCEECGVAFATYESLRRHLKSSIHVDEPKPRLDCPICHKDLASKRTLQEHMRTHTGEKPYLCTECGARFASKDSIRRHRRVHTGERPYECQECGKVFRDHTALKVHKTTHTGERPHPCEECEKRFLTRTQLSNHTKRCHPTLMSLEKTNAADASEETTQDSNLDSEVMPYPVEENEPSSSSLLEPEMEPLIGTKEEETDRLVIIGGRVSYEDEAGPSGVADFQRQHSGITINHEESSPFFFQSGGVEFTPQESSPMPQGPMEELLCYPKEEETDRLVIRGGRVSYEEDAGSSGIEEELLPELETKPPSGLLNGDVSVAAHQLFPQPINESITMSNTSPFDCPICHLSLANHTTLNVHMKLHDRPHSKERPFLCEKCGCSFATQGALTHHYNQHGKLEGRKKRIRCKMCGKLYATRTALMYHQKEKHKGETAPQQQRRAQMKCGVVG